VQAQARDHTRLRFLIFGKRKLLSSSERSFVQNSLAPRTVMGNANDDTVIIKQKI